MTVRADSEELPVKEFIQNVDDWKVVIEAKANVLSRATILRFLLWAYGSLLASTMLLFFLQGFQLWKFSLPESTLKWLGGATIGELTGLLTIALKDLFAGKQKPRQAQRKGSTHTKKTKPGTL